MSASGVSNSSMNHQPDQTLHLPRILCLHGGGTNARIFRTQCRVIRRHLASFFRLVFVDAPFSSPPGPDVGRVYAKWGPFCNWFPMGVDPETISAEPDLRTIAPINEHIQTAMEDDDRAGATGPWVALLGFSRGAQIAGSLMLRQQQQQQQQQKQLQDTPVKTALEAGTPTNFRFAVLMAGPAPLIPMTEIIDSGDTDKVLLRVPTVHVYGRNDSVLRPFKHLLDSCCAPDSIRKVEWDADHQVPLKTVDVDVVVGAILDVARQTGVLHNSTGEQGTVSVDI
ncbi:hypothetical protein BO70DRAFT_359810 [Aspergillus heteromorphus CBS 117.55]|uniref:Serine hydrolase domain-containing protein n=1 Tax=Aspergillus heteromorphus CBS 117.55 TaxID=1448321 RepID=A0A317WVR5_9EURO|nr:uncharacterized protein BO70DRAFT_359810 [Aspergillus heteromorphus CBS 117.55]PWY88370.1 hypothetical protein BO70DRAFT_359810 [Aspergillus heteromorphus CBS 117.55]